jgi:hypothetical protein
MTRTWRNHQHWTPGANAIGDINADILTRLPNGQPYSEGSRDEQWLGNVGVPASDCVSKRQGQRERCEHAVDPVDCST